MRTFRHLYNLAVFISILVLVFISVIVVAAVTVVAAIVVTALMFAVSCLPLNNCTAKMVVIWCWDLRKTEPKIFMCMQAVSGIQAGT